MLMLEMIVLGLATFAAMLAFVRLCDRCEPSSASARHWARLMTLLHCTQRRRVRVPRVRDAAPGKVLRRAMTTDYIAVAFTILFTIATSLLLGRYMFKVFTGGRTLLDPVLVPIERLVLRLTGVDPEKQQDWKRYSMSLLMSNVVMWAATFAIVSLQNSLPLNPGRHRQHGADAVVQHDLELRDEHEPAALQRRDGAVVLLADVRDQLPAVRDRGDGRRGLHRRHPRPGRQPADAAGQLLRGPHARDRARVPAARAAGVGHPDVAGHADDVRGRGQGHDRRGSGAADRPRRHGRRRVDQAARHERRRLLRAQLGASVREPDAALELRRDLVHHDHSDGDGLDARVT